jgi:tungstate transport system substrate-binding protein
MGRRPLVGAARAVGTLALGLLLIGCGGGPSSEGGDGAQAAAAQGTLVLATTTSTQDSGLLEVLLPAFTAATGWEVTPLAVGTGQALELGERGEADVLLVHAPAAERELVATGTTGRRLLVMHNDFLLVGPAADPAMVEGLPVSDALKRIAAAEAPFVSRGDGSGTETKELELWEQAEITPAGGWYQSTGQGMGATLRVASEKAGYTLTDRATYLAQRDSLDLAALVEGDPGLLNLYHVIEMTTEAGSRVQAEGAEAFTDWIVGPEAQRIIGEFGTETYSEPLFTPDAGATEEELVG